MIHLFSPLTIRKVKIKNRIVFAPAAQYASEDGMASSWHLVHLGSRAVGGAGIVFTEEVAVSPEGRGTPKHLGIWKDEHIGPLKAITSFIHEYGGVAGIQIGHYGRKASVSEPWNGSKYLNRNEGGWNRIYAPSPIPFSADFPSPIELNITAIEKVIADFKDAALRARKAGFKILEIHAGHGYLLHEFLSPATNKRTDAFGGNFEKRTLLLRTILAEIGKVWPTEYPLFLRLPATDWINDQESWQLKDAVALVEMIQTLEIDLIVCVSGGLATNQQMPPDNTLNLHFAQKVMASGQVLAGISAPKGSADTVNRIIRDEQSALVYMSRPLIKDPYYPLYAAKELGYPADWPLVYRK